MLDKLKKLPLIVATAVVTATPAAAQFWPFLMGGAAVAAVLGFGVINGQAPSTVGNANSAISAGSYYVSINAALSAPRTYTLPAAATFGVGALVIADPLCNIAAPNVATVAAAGGDSINLGSVTLGASCASLMLQSDGANSWSVLSIYPPQTLVGADGLTQIFTGADFIVITNATGTTLSASAGSFTVQGSAGSVAVTGSGVLNVQAGGNLAVSSSAQLTLTAQDKLIVRSNNAAGGNFTQLDTGPVYAGCTGGGCPAAFVASEAEIGAQKITATGTAPGAGTAKTSWVSGTNAGTCKLISYAGTSTTPVTIIDNVGGGC